MAAQLQPTPIVSGKDAEGIKREINLKQPSEKYFECTTQCTICKNIKKKGL